MSANKPLIDLHELKARIESANVYALAKRTGCELAPKLSLELGRNVWLKREDLQDVFSFKIRGATNRIAELTDEERACGVCAASAGNHAQGIATAAAYYNTKAIIFMPVTTPAIKVAAVQSHGAETRLVGDSYDAACEAAITYAQMSGAVFIHPFDEISVIAGQGTVGREILEQMPRTPDAVYIPVGGGGLISGVGAWVKSVSPNTKIIAVEPEGAPTLLTSLEAGQPTTLESVDSFADGVAVKRIGTHTFDVAQRLVDEVICVSNDEICAAVKDVFEATRTVVEPAGALALAGLIKHTRLGQAPEGDSVVILSGANVNFDRIGHIVERAELGAGEEMLFAAAIPEKPGAFLNFCNALGRRAVTEFNYRYTESDTAHVLVGIKTRDLQDREQVTADMATHNISITDLSNDRLAKRHLRHMVGGRTSTSIAEVIYRFEFPERPGALTDFLIALDDRWNISLFHYRNHGNTTGHVLCGFQVPKGDMEALEESLSKTGYPMSEETDSKAYEYFLRA
ncbi:L-threonine ammonia-lyase [Litorimonas taeanensis]|uniref:L-threonine dehydratase n=1 Tax=Litorimonas taeanensis TaxID=568099 RepID=A0A420WE75_9PROT|nr:threonine ammonia-lyase, biosynthetic [Litorimonas taeanensis]RKQ69324.1 L-threonine ammonia-lyase [Litorimonas taeanensis]